MQRPDLSNTPPDVIRYIEFLERKLGLGASRADALTPLSEALQEVVYTEPETTSCILTVSASGWIKRTYRHLYPRQHRGGMGIFDLDTVPPDHPSLLASVDEKQTALVFTSNARVFRLSVGSLDSLPVRSKGINVLERFGLEAGERVVAILPEQARGYVALASELGKVRCLRHHLFGEHMRQGTQLYNLLEFGPLAAACWTPGSADLLLVTRAGTGIRFPEKAIPPQGGLGLRVAENDSVVSIASVDDSSSVFVLSADGKGTLRQMSGFAANKSPGGSGKLVLKSSSVVGACTTDLNDDLFIISRLGKIIRFKADEVPPTEGVVQGVNCIALRADEAKALVNVCLVTLG